MGLLSPWWLLGGVVAAGLPVWLHLLQQHKQDPIQFASTMLMERRTESTTYQRRLKYKALMALRLLLLLLIALAFAQPFLNKPPAILNAANVLHLIVVDNSFSMREGDRLNAARTAALAALPSGGVAQVWSLGSHVSFLSPVTKDRNELTGAINSVGPSDEKSSFAELARALRDAGRSSGRALQVSFVTDAQRTAMPPSFSDLVLEPGNELKVIDVGRKMPNYTVETVNAPRTISDLSKAKVNATLTAFNAPAAKKTVVLRINGKQIASKTVEVPENGRVTVEFTGLEGPYGWLRGEVAIADADALEADNKFYFTVERADPRKVLLIEEQRGSRAGMYFKTALESSTESFFRVEEMSAGNAASVNLSGYAFVVLNDPGLAVKGMEAALKTYVEGGGALLIAAGTQTGSLPVIPVVGIKSEGSKVATRGAQRFYAAANVDPTFPSLRRAGRLEGVRFFQFAGMEVPEGAVVAAKLDDGSPLLLEKKMGEGKVLVFASSFDNVSNDFPVKPGFVPFIEQTAAYLGNVEERTSSYLVDSYLDLRADQKRASSVEVLGPNGERALSLKEAAAASSLRLGESGFYDVRRENGRQELVAVNVDRRESDLDPTPRENLQLWEQTGKSAGGTGQAGSVVDTPQPEPQSFWWWVALFAFVTLLAESLLSARYLQAQA
ncbi:BatA domain-containing protein [Bryobacter aggregatus]|uniref:BatA domain-containing protein n=1 Tax=Bryobacter aggregatus TaxID=360054 RepID=UPI0004E1B086|nr:BatA domain-containing protein [Bryobacter aggregatus]